MLHAHQVLLQGAWQTRSVCRFRQARSRRGPIKQRFNSQLPASIPHLLLKDFPVAKLPFARQDPKSAIIQTVLVVLFSPIRLADTCTVCDSYHDGNCSTEAMAGRNTESQSDWCDSVVDWSSDVDQRRMFVCPTLTPLYYAAIYRELTAAQRLSYNQLSACSSFNDLILFFERSFLGRWSLCCGNGSPKPQSPEVSWRVFSPMSADIANCGGD